MNKHLPKQCDIKTALWSEHSVVMSEIRKTVFIDEQGVSPEEEWDELDSQVECEHLLASVTDTKNDRTEYIGTARILNSGKIGRVAVLKNYRNQGVGACLVRAALMLGFKKHSGQLDDKIFLYAQVSSIPFYERLGFKAEGDIFLDAGIEHKKMYFQNTKAIRSELFSQFYSDSVNRLENTHDYLLHLTQQASTTQRHINILSQGLRPDIFDNAKFVENISKIARTNRNAKIRILIQSPLSKVARYHSLIALAKRLPSRIELKKLEKSIELNGEAYAIFDETRLVYFNDEESLTGFSNYTARAECKHLLENYNYLWNKRSKPDPDMRVLSL